MKCISTAPECLNSSSFGITVIFNYNYRRVERMTEPYVVKNNVVVISMGDNHPILTLPIAMYQMTQDNFGLFKKNYQTSYLLDKQIPQPDYLFWINNMPWI